MSDELSWSSCVRYTYANQLAWAECIKVEYVDGGLAANDKYRKMAELDAAGAKNSKQEAGESLAQIRDGSIDLQKGWWWCTFTEKQLQDKKQRLQLDLNEVERLADAANNAWKALTDAVDAHRNALRAKALDILDCKV
jgi:hypothetical protein